MKLILIILVVFQLTNVLGELQGWHVSKENCTHMQAVEEVLLPKVRQLLRDANRANLANAVQYVSRFALRKDNCLQGFAVVDVLPHGFMVVQMNYIGRNLETKLLEIDAVLPDPVNIKLCAFALLAEIEAKEYEKLMPEDLPQPRENTVAITDDNKSVAYRVAGNVVKGVKGVCIVIGAIGSCCLP